MIEIIGGTGVVLWMLYVCVQGYRYGSLLDTHGTYIQRTEQPTYFWVVMGIYIFITMALMAGLMFMVTNVS